MPAQDWWAALPLDAWWYDAFLGRVLLVLAAIGVLDALLDHTDRAALGLVVRKWRAWEAPHDMVNTRERVIAGIARRAGTFHGSLARVFGTRWTHARFVTGAMGAGFVVTGLYLTVGLRLLGAGGYTSHTVFALPYLSLALPLAVCGWWSFAITMHTAQRLARATGPRDAVRLVAANLVASLVLGAAAWVIAFLLASGGDWAATAPRLYALSATSFVFPPLAVHALSATGLPVVGHLIWQVAPPLAHGAGRLGSALATGFCRLSPGSATFYAVLVGAIVEGLHLIGARLFGIT